jgi:hypothetical protein
MGLIVFFLFSPIALLRVNCYTASMPIVKFPFSNGFLSLSCDGAPRTLQLKTAILFLFLKYFTCPSYAYVIGNNQKYRFHLVSAHMLMLLNTGYIFRYKNAERRQVCFRSTGLCQGEGVPALASQNHRYCGQGSVSLLNS